MISVAPTRRTHAVCYRLGVGGSTRSTHALVFASFDRSHAPPPTPPPLLHPLVDDNLEELKAQGHVGVPTGDASSYLLDANGKRKRERARARAQRIFTLILTWYQYRYSCTNDTHYTTEHSHCVNVHSLSLFSQVSATPSTTLASSVRRGPPAGRGN